MDDETVSGVFITLKRDGMLRGCRGCVEGTYPLRKTIWEISRSSAFDDPRFNPMEQEELEGLEISISLLGMMEQVKVEDPSQFREKIQLGRDGICLRLKGNSALFLPEVAPEQGWNVETTLRQLCRKAGLEDDDWRNPETKCCVSRRNILKTKWSGSWIAGAVITDGFCGSKQQQEIPNDGNPCCLVVTSA